jgi:DNA-binding GntR family transcriptional regulator
VGGDTVLHSLRMLREAGLIFTVAKRGSYVCQPSKPSQTQRASP